MNQPNQFAKDTICKAAMLRRHLEKGRGLSLADFDFRLERSPPASLREFAISSNAPPAVHRLLDELKEPAISETLASKLGAQAIDRGHYDALLEVYRQCPEGVVRWMTIAPAIAAQKILYRYLEGKRTPTQTTKMLVFATELGADWTVYRKTVHENMRMLASKFDKMVIETQAHALQYASKDVVPSSRSRPRL